MKTMRQSCPYVLAVLAIPLTLALAAVADDVSFHPAKEAKSAKQLRIDSKVGSLEPGKDADFVIWSESPLSSSTHCEQTWIDGRRYFDYDTDKAARAAMEEERTRLVAAARKARESMKKEDKDNESKSWAPSYWMEDADASCHEEGKP